MKLLIHDYGGYAFTLQLATELAAGGHEVRYLYSVTTQLVQRLDPGGGNGRLTVQGVRLGRSFHKYSFLQRRAAEIEHGQRVAEAIRQYRPEVVVSADAPLDAQATILAASRKVGARFVYWFQDAVGLATRRLLRQRLLLVGEAIGLYYETLERRLLRQSDGVVLISPDFRPLMDQWGVTPEKTHRIPNWAPLAEIPLQPKCNAWSRAYKLDEAFVFLYAGILGLKHNPELFVELAQALDGQAQVVVVSDGGSADWLQNRQGELQLANLQVLPFQPKEVFAQVLGAADVLVSILSPEAGVFSVPSKVLTYLCAGRPLLLSLPLENQAARLVHLAQAGLAAAPPDLAGWLEAARVLRGQERLRAVMGANARAYAEAHFDIRRIAGQFESLFNSVNVR